MFTAIYLNVLFEGVYQHMTVLIYSTKTGDAEKRILSIIEPRFSETSSHFFRTISALQSALRRPREDMIIVILVATSTKELEDLLSIRDLLEDIRIILILPNSDQETITDGLKLRPRFLTSCDSDFSDVAAVLRRMLRNMSSDKKG